MNQELVFETIPFETDPEFQEEEFELDREKGRRRPFGDSKSRSFRPRARTGTQPKRSKRPPVPRPQVIPGRRRRPWEVIRAPYYVPLSEPFPAEPEPPYGSERVRWVQDCLNHAMRLQLPVTGLMNAETRSAVRSFQKQQGLRVSGIVGPDTEQALGSVCRLGPADNRPEDEEPTVSERGYGTEPEIGDFFGRIASGLGSAYDRVADVVGRTAGSRIIDLTAKSVKSHRKGTRDPKTVYALVLHQMACCAQRRDPLKSYLNIKSHFAILRDGTILQLHPISALIWASNGFNARSVSVEFAGNFPSTRGKWWQGYKYGKDRPTQAQFEAGRYLIRYLTQTMGLTHVLAHRQSSGTRENDPGPDIWSQVGQWAIDKLGLKDGGPGFKIGSGNPIPDAWRKWKTASVTPERDLELEDAFLETEIAHDLAEWETDAGSDREFGKKIISVLRQHNVVPPNLRAVGPLTQATVASLKQTPGLYMIQGRGKKPYFGQTTDLKTRLQQHLWCLEHLGVPTNSFDVSVKEHNQIAKLPKSQQQQLLRKEEKPITSVLVPRGLLTNKRTELEQELWGSAWI